MFTTKVNIDGFGAVVKALSKMSGKDFEYTVKAEVGHIFKGAIRMTPVAKQKKIVQRTMPTGYKFKRSIGNRLVTKVKSSPKNFHSGEPRMQRGGPRGGVIYSKPYTYWMNTKQPGGLGPMAWENFIEEQKKKTQERIDNIGTSVAVIYYMGKKGGIKYPGKVKGQAKADKPKVRKNVYNNVFGYSKGEKTKYTFTASTDGLKMTSEHGLGEKIKIAMDKRTKFFIRSVNKGFINDLKTYMPKNYPLLFDE